MSAAVDAQVEVYLGAALGWVNVTEAEDVRDPSATHGGGITITRGRANEGEQVDPGKANLWLNDRHGKYSPRNLAGPYYGLLNRNTPLRIGVRLVRDTFGRTVSNGWSSADTGQPYTTAGGAASFGVSGGFGTHAHPTINVLRRTTLPSVLSDCEQVVTAKSSAAVTGAALVTGARFRVQSNGAYYWLRTEFDANSTDVILKITRVDHSGNLFDLAVLDPVPGLSYTAGTLIRSRASVCGNHLAIKAWLASGPEPLDWQLTVTDETIAAAGQVGLQTWVVSGNTNSPTLTVSFDNYEVIDRRAHMEVPAWPPRWDLSERDRWVPIEAAGILRRLGKGNPPSESALNRAYRDSGALAWWSMEEEGQATWAASGIAGQPPLDPSGTGPASAANTSGTVEFGTDAGASGAARLVSMVGGGFLSAPIPASTANSWRFDISARLISGSYGGSSMIPITWFGGTASEGRPYEFDILFTDVHTKFVGGDALLGGGPDLTIDINPYDSILHIYTVEMVKSGSDVWVYFYRDGVVHDSVIWPAVTFPTLSSVEFGYYGHSGDAMPAIAHAAVFAPTQEATGSVQVAAVNGHAGERAADRITRLCGEESVPIVIRGDPDTSVRMGVQLPGTWLALAAEAADADRGIWYEARDQLGMVYRTHGTLYNQTALELDYSAGYVAEPFEPTPDDEQVVNDATVTRTGGATYRAVQETGPLSTAPPPAGIGSYPGPGGGTVNFYVDEQARSLAFWERHRGTWDEERYPSISVDLRAEAWTSDPDRAMQAAALDPGDLVAVTSPPVDLPADGTEQLVQGTTEVLNPHERVITWNTTPGGPYRVATVDGPQRCASVNATLASGIDDDDLTASVASQAGTLLWRTGTTVTLPDRFPMRVRLGGSTTGGEVTLVSGISGGTSPQTFTFLSRGAVARAWDAGTTVQVADPVTLAK